MSTSNQLVCVRKPEPNMAAIFEDMYLNERLVDVTLSCSDGQLQAHKLVLAASSPYFSGIFNKLANPFHYPVIVIKDMQIDDLKLIVDFMYKGQLTISQERFMSLIKSAENLQINGLSNVGGIVTTNNIDSREGSNGGGNNRNLNSSPRFKRTKKSSTAASSTMNLNHHQAIFARNYHHHQSSRHIDEIDSRLSSPQPDKLLEQSMITGDSLDDSHPSHQFSYASNNNNSNTNDPTSSRNLTNQQLHTPSPSSIHVPHLSTIDQQHQQHQLTNQLQVLSHSLTANRSSLAQGNANSQQSSLQLAQHHQQQQTRGRVHPCNICWKTFREKANLKRHLQVHSLDRIIYACPDCNKTFSWKDNYIRHTKTAHHINNIKQQS